MPLIKCDECGRKISDQSRFCPRCGHPTHLNSAYRALHAEAEAEVEATTPPATENEQVETPQQVEEHFEEARHEDGVGVDIDDLDRAAIFAENRRRNDRMKTWIFIIVTAAVFGLIIAVYCLTPKDTGVKESVMEESVEAVDSVTTDTVKATETAKPAEEKSVTTAAEKTASKPATTEPAKAEATPADAPHEVTVAPLSEQVAPSAPAPAPVPATEE